MKEEWGAPKVSDYPRGVFENANFQGADAEILAERVRCAVICDQIAQLVHAEAVAVEYHIDTTNTMPLEWYRSQIPKWIDEGVNSTPISFDPKAEPGSYTMPVGAKHPWRVGKTIKCVQIAEAHEMGHRFRPYVGDFFRQHFRPGFDMRALDKTVSESTRLYLFSGGEIAERMSQLKNYFGINDDTPFTEDHLRYARENYVKDTGVNNEMDIFFSTITEKTQPEFIRLINSSGI